MRARNLLTELRNPMKVGAVDAGDARMKGDVKPKVIQIKAAGYPESIEAELETLAETYRPVRARWTRRQDELLRRFYGRVPTHALAARLRRTPTAVEHRAFVLRRFGCRLECDE